MGCSDNIDKIADRFGVSESSVIRCRNRVVKAILKHLKCRFIFWPKIADMQIVVDSFAERNGFPGIVGALDGTHIEIKTPGVNGASYINRKGYASLQLQAVCNHEMIFTDVFAGFPGSCHDARVLRNSDLWEDGLQLCNNVNNILADAAYPLRRWLMTPYRDNGHLTPQQKRFNFNLSVNRVVIERAFGLLKGRFRRLRFLDTQKIETAVDVIVVCCILHSICIMHHDEVDDFMSRDEYAGNVVANNAVIQEQDGEGALKRIAITRMFE